MSDEILREVACPNCRNPIDIREHGRYVTCDACSSQFMLAGHYCPTCFAYHAEDTLFCGECGASLKRTCQRCQSSNWTGNEFCLQCGAALDIFDVVLLQNKEVARQAQAKRLEMIKKLKAEDEQASQKRLEAMQIIEEDRLAQLQARKQKQARRDRQILAATFALVALAALVILALALLR